MTAIVSFEQLQEATGYSQCSTVEKCLRKNGVPFLYGNNGKIFTTVDALNAAIGLKSSTPKNNNEAIEIL